MIDGSPELWVEEFKRRFRKQVRFAVRSPDDRYSAVWMTKEQKSDFYIGVRSLMGNRLKISLHKSRECRLAFEKGYHASTVARGLIPAEEDRALVIWRRSPSPEVGAALVVVLVFPTDFLHLDALPTTAKQPLFLRAAPKGKAVEVAFCYSREPVVTLEPKLLQYGAPLFWTDLKNGDTVWMISREIDFDATVFPSDETLNNLKGQLVDPDGFTKAAAERRSLTVQMWNAPKDNEPFVIMEVGGIPTSGDVIQWISSLFHAARTET